MQLNKNGMFGEECENQLTQKNLLGDVVLIFCNHLDNKEDTEGNCRSDICPIKLIDSSKLDTWLECPRQYKWNERNYKMLESKEDKWLSILAAISVDMEDDAKHFDGQPFNGKTVAEYFGKQGAAISALANILSNVIKELP